MHALKILASLLVFVKLMSPIKITFNISNDFNLENLNLYQNNNVLIQEEWYLSIPILNLQNIQIRDSVESDILENYIGHFPITSYIVGNVCLAAHNSGYENNYFERLDELQVGDEIYYNYFGNITVYYVSSIVVIDENDFSWLKSDENNMLTLMTCINSLPSKRLCVQAISKEV